MKKLYSGRYTFVPDQQSITINGVFTRDKLLLITNITTNEIIYNFADPARGITDIFINSDNETTNILLTFDTTSMSESDSLQIFTEAFHNTIQPAEDLMDAVGKLRVSTPGNLIDTDFEYGLQGTKWETQQTVNNIPTVFSASGDIPVEGIQSIVATQDSKQVLVSVNTPHGLEIGNPISVQGVSQYQAQGFFIVSGVPDVNSFFFELDVPAAFSGDIAGSYSSVVAAKFFEGSNLSLAPSNSAITNRYKPTSTISVTTAETHGLSRNTKLYLRNTIGPKTLAITDPTATAPDGRPYIDTESVFEVSNDIDTTVSTGRSGAAAGKVVAYDWESTYVKYLIATDINFNINQISWIDHGLHNRAALLFSTPRRGDSDAGLTDGTVYYVKVIDQNTISLCDDYETLTSIVNLSAVSSTYGPARLGLVYRVEKGGGSSYETAAFYRAYNFISNKSVSGYPYSYYTYSYIRVDLPILSLSNDLNGNIDNLRSVRLRRVYHPYYYYYVNLYVDRQNFRNLGSGLQYFWAGYTWYSGGRNLYFNLDVTSAVSVSGDNVYINMAWYRRYYYSYVSPTYYFDIEVIDQTLQVDQSGYDLTVDEWGKGQIPPAAIVGFQGATQGSVTQSQDNFTYLSGNYNNGRYGTVSLTSPTTTANSQGAGSFTVNYSLGSTWSSSSDPVFIAFVNILTTDRNTFYLPDHGLASGDTVTVTIDNTAYANGERFGFADSQGNLTTLTQQSFQVSVSSITADIIKPTLLVSPNTDDIQTFPSAFNVTYFKDNELYNTFYALNHKITGTSEVTYYTGGTNVDTNFTVTNNFNLEYLISNLDAGENIPNPTLVLYEGNTYTFTINASGHPFYFTTDDGTGWSAGTFTGEYTTGVTGSQTDVGIITIQVSAGDSAATPLLYYQCGNHAAMGGMIELKPPATVIGGVTNQTVYNAVRVNDSRLSLASGSSSSSQATTTEVGEPNNSPTSYWINVESALGLTPTQASIIAVQFRGDFSNENEYVVLEFDDGSNAFVGVNGGADTGAWLTDPNWGIKNISDILVVDPSAQTTNLGFNVTISPTPQVNFGRFIPGSSDYWQVRFVVSGDSGIVVFTNTGDGEQFFEVASLRGAYDGVFSLEEVTSPNSFNIAADFNVPIRKFSIDNTMIDAVNSIITLPDPHNLKTGDRLIYINNGSPGGVGIVEPNQENAVFAIVLTPTAFSLAVSQPNALANQKIPVAAHSGIPDVLYSDNIIRIIPGVGSIGIQTGSNQVTGSGTDFLTAFKRYDIIHLVDDGFLQPFTVDSITTDTTMTLFETVSSNIANEEYFFETQMILRPDGYALHLSFDGGVDITAGTSPNSKIVRQTRKYFRYQSGKGIQNSVAINFNPPKIVKTLIKSSGTTAFVTTQEAHNLSVNDEIKIAAAEVTIGDNTYNGTFTISSVTSPFNFSYIMDNEPQQSKAGGFPTYVRTGWRDSFVRTGMFDDQNGFFWEYDGQSVHAVRRSSTLQLAGTVNTTRGSQVITGNETSFTTQLLVNDKVVIRGQSYKVVEISSDLRLVVQPVYRGVSSRNVKLTKTVDTRTPQSAWNIDICDGSGPSGFIFDETKIQMAYFDYSWYGAGKIRYGWKDQNGHVIYVHEYKHNNRLNESYFRSGNLPGRYEIENGPTSNTAPTLFHFGTSVIMDGTFDDDKAYLFTKQSRQMAFTLGGSAEQPLASNSTFQLITLNGRRVYVYAFDFTTVPGAVGMAVRDTAGTVMPEDTYITQITTVGGYGRVFTNYPALATLPSSLVYPTVTASTNMTFGEASTVDLTQPLPLVSLRLAPSVDSSLTGAIGEREIINRMQLQLKQAGITCNRDVEVFLILNSLPSRLSFQDADTPSLSELIEHVMGDTLRNGTTILATKASAGSVEIDLKDLLELGNSILGGDGIYPEGPDLLTIAVQPQTTTGVLITAPFTVSGKISWSESQA